MYYTTNRRRSHRNSFNNQPSIENIFSDFMNTPINSIISKKENPTSHPATNIIEEDDNFILEFAVPGIKKEIINISIDKQTLTISNIEKETEDQNIDKLNYKKREFNYSTFERKFTIPNNILLDKIGAELNNGILKITLSKNPAFKKTISIK